MFGYAIEKATNRKVHYWDLNSKPSDTETHEYVECSVEEKPDLYEAPIPTPYDGDALISWALQQVFAEALIPHMAAFLDFANKATESSKANFLAYATAVGLSETAQTIVSKAIELGADLE
jgi:hypothetical protein